MNGISKSKNQQNKPIGVFDSGVGGLSILLELQKLLPNENFVFLADQLYVPYGEKSKKQLVERCFKITDYFIKYHNIKMMVVACNTATCGAIDELREKYSLPIVGTVPAIKVARDVTKSGTVAIISTPSTSKSEALRKLIKDNCKNINVLNIGCPNLEDAVEKGELNSSEVSELLLKYLKDIKNSKTDYLVLGCTHYPFLKRTISKTLGSRIKLLDSGKAIAKHTKSLLLNYGTENDPKQSSGTLYFTTGDALKFSKVAGKLLKHKVQTKKVKI